MAKQMTSIAEVLIRQIDWSKLREIDGVATSVGIALVRLLTAEKVEDAQSAYWEIENHVVVQDDVYESAEACVGVLIAALIDERPRFVRIAILGLLFQILSGSASEIELQFNNEKIVERCKGRAREGLWLLVRELVLGEDAALDVLRLLVESERIAEFELLCVKV
jgi:hypothetical protein